MGLVPTIYTTLRVFWLGNLPSEYSYSIAGQLSWVSLIYEVIDEAIILPLFYFIGKVAEDKKELTNRMKTGLLVTLGIYLVLSTVIMSCAEPLLKLMATDESNRCFGNVHKDRSGCQYILDSSKIRLGWLGDIGQR